MNPFGPSGAAATPAWLAMLWTGLAFACGALPFSLWIGRLWLGVDVRTVGDHNPGATNVLRAGGPAPAAAALLLDVLKGALPVALAYHALQIHGVWLVPIALAPIAGHAFSPLLGGEGGKAVATTGGVWMGLTLWEGPTVGGFALLLGARMLGGNGRAVLFALVVMAAYLLLTPPAWNGLVQRPAPTLIGALAAGNLLLVAWKHRADFRLRAGEGESGR